MQKLWTSNPKRPTPKIPKNLKPKNYEKTEA